MVIITLNWLHMYLNLPTLKWAGTVLTETWTMLKLKFTLNVGASCLNSGSVFIHILYVTVLLVGSEASALLISKPAFGDKPPSSNHSSVVPFTDLPCDHYQSSMCILCISGLDMCRPLYSLRYFTLYNTRWSITSSSLLIMINL